MRIFSFLVQGKDAHFLAFIRYPITVKCCFPRFCAFYLFLGSVGTPLALHKAVRELFAAKEKEVTK